MRIPEMINQGKHSESCISFVWQNHIDHQRLAISDEEYLMTVDSDRYACGWPLPDFQRQFKWSLKQQVQFIESVWLGLPIGSFTVHDSDYESNGKPLPYSGLLIDGQQRLTTLERYWKDEFSVFGLLYSELTKREKRRFLSIKFTHFECGLWDDQLIRGLYNRLSFGGTPHLAGEMA